MCLELILIFFPFQDGRLDIQNALAAIQSLPSIPASVLQSTHGLPLGDIQFVKIQTTLRMCAVLPAILEKWVGDGKFNPERMAENDYSHSMAILVILSPNTQGTALESVGIRLVICWHKAQIAQISTIPFLIKYAHSLLVAEEKSTQLQCRTFCTIVGNYGGHMAFAMHPLFCVAYPLEFVHQNDPAQMTFRSQHNHPVSCIADGLLVCQLLTWDCPKCEYALATCNGCLLIPRGVQFPEDLYPEIVILCNHTEPYRDPKTGKEAPFMTVVPFTSRDTLFYGVAGDLELYTAEEVITLRNAGIFKSSSNASQSFPKLPSLASLGQSLSSPTSPKAPPHSPKIEPDSSSKKQDQKGSLKSHKRPVSTAAGSHVDLEKSEWEHKANCRQMERVMECKDCSHPKSRSSHHEHTTGYERSRASNHSRSVDPVSSSEHPSLKE